MSRTPLSPLTGRLIAALIACAGLTTLAPEARAQGTLTAPAGQARITAPGGLRGRSALRRPYKHRMPRRRR